MSQRCWLTRPPCGRRRRWGAWEGVAQRYAAAVLGGGWSRGGYTSSPPHLVPGCPPPAESAYTPPLSPVAPQKHHHTGHGSDNLRLRSMYYLVHGTAQSNVHSTPGNLTLHPLADLTLHPWQTLHSTPGRPYTPPLAELTLHPWQTLHSTPWQTLHSTPGRPYTPPLVDLTLHPW